eukprot:scaffold13661_cov21-Tisochrysis_lutea.AAC.4
MASTGPKGQSKHAACSGGALPRRGRGGSDSQGSMDCSEAEAQGGCASHASGPQPWHGPQY